MRALVISDIHGNIDVLHALERHWGERFAHFERIICLGDLVDYGPEPHEVIGWVRARATDVIRGNHDHAMATGGPCGSSPAYLEASVVTRERLRHTLTADDLGYLRDLPYHRTVDLDDVTWHLVHASPADALHAYVPPDVREEGWRTALRELVGERVLIGHTHLAFVRPIGGGLVVNPGSLGMPKDGNPHGSYVVIDEGAVQFCRVAYDPEPMLGRLGALDLPHGVLNQLTQAFRTGI